MNLAAGPKGIRGHSSSIHGNGSTERYWSRQGLRLHRQPGPVAYSITFNRQRTLELVGAHTVQIRKSTCDTKWATLAVTITALGRMLTPVLVFKDMPEGCIAR